MKDKIDNLIEEKMFLDARHLNNKSTIDVKHSVLTKIKTKKMNESINAQYSLKSTLFSYWSIPIGLSIVVLAMVFTLKSDLTQIQNVSFENIINKETIGNQDNNSVVYSEKKALTNDLNYLSKVLTL